MLPELYNIPRQSSYIINDFGGLNTTQSCKSGELAGCCNMDSAFFPSLGSREKRTLCSECDGIINGVGSFDGFFYTFYKNDPKSIFLKYRGKEYDFTSYSNSVDYTQKRKFAFLENAIFIIPDNVIFFVDSFVFKSSDYYQKSDYTTAKEKYKNTYSNNSYSPAEYSGIGHIYHNRITSLSFNVNNEYVFYPCGFDERIEIGDVVTVKFDAFSPNSTSYDDYYTVMNRFKEGYILKVKDLVKTSHKLPSGKTVEEITEVIFDNNSFDSGSVGRVMFREISVEKKMPAVTDITSHNNRIWGVGANKIYASKLGEADEWNDFGVDSYGTMPSSSFAASAGTDGDFTAVIPYGNYIYAMKENYIHKIYGDTPDEYTISNIDAPGAVAGADTLCVCGMYLMYASNIGICLLREGYPRIVSKKIGKLSPVSAAAYDNKYYVLCRTESGRCIYVYDCEYDIWMTQSCSDSADNLCADKNGICFSEGNKLVYLSSDVGDEYEKNIHWNFKIRFDRKDMECNTSIRAIARITLEQNASFTARIVYDDNTISAICGFCYDEVKNGSSVLRLPVKKDIGFFIEFKGVGGFILKNIKFNYYRSSEE